MAPAPARLYQEARLDLTPASLVSTVDVIIPSTNGFFSRHSPKRRRLDHVRVTYDETYFSQQHLSVESAIHFRHPRSGGERHTSPRGILWRILNERKLLELQVVDLHQDNNEKTEAHLTLRITFPSAIRPSGIAFAEQNSDGRPDATLAFVLTHAGELFTLTLKKGLFTTPGLAEETYNWIKSARPNAFGYRTPFKLQARTDKELWASLTDGALVRLDSENGLAWRESFFTHGSWKALRGLIPWKSTTSTRFEDLDLDSTTAISFGLSPDGKHLWAICLDHTLKAWNVETGKLSFTQDLARDDSRDLENSVQQVIPPTRANFLQFLPVTSEDQYMIATFSPTAREFKFWLIRDLEDTTDLAWEDASPNCTFVPPIEDLENAAVWSLEYFHVETPASRQASWLLWILVRSGMKCHVYCAKFNFHEHPDAVMKAWRNSWVAVDDGFNSTAALKENPTNPSDVDPLAFQTDATGDTERWLEFLFYPGRFTASTLETALVVYCRSQGAYSKHSVFEVPANGASLKARICQVVGSLVQLEPVASDELAYERYQRNLAVQWQIFYGVVKDLHGRREKVVCLCYDIEEKLPWLVLADSVCALRLCSQSEILWHNRDLFANPRDLGPGVLLDSLTDASSSQLGQLFFALDVFRASFSKAFIWKYASVVRSEILESYGSGNHLETIQTIYNSSGFQGQVSDEDYNNLTDALEPLGGFAKLDNDLLLGTLDFLDETQRGRSHKKQLTHYGARLLIRGAQETLTLGSEIIMALLLLVTFIAGELEENDLPHSFDAEEVFSALASKVREYELLEWLAATTFQSVKLDASKATDMTGVEVFYTERPQTTTLFEYMFIGDWSTILDIPVTTPELLTYWCRAWTFGLRLSEQYDNISCHILGTLIKKNDAKLALMCLCFTPATPWGEYLSGRLSLMTGEFAKAALQFKSAADGLATGKFLVPAESDSASLLDGVERAQLNDGFARFYQHVIELFEHFQTPSYAADFAQLALQATEQESKQSPSLKTDLLARLFSASLRTFRFEVAFSALMQQTDLALRKSSLKSLVQAVLKANHIRVLLDFPYSADIALEVDEHLAALAAKPETSLSSNVFGPPISDVETIAYHKILYAFRLQFNDLRGAASCIWDHLQILLQEQKNGLRGEDVDDQVAQDYLALINTLSLMDADQAWILSKSSGNEATTGTKDKRKVVTLEDVRRQWQGELDRVADIAAGRFSFGLGATAMEIEA